MAFIAESLEIVNGTHPEFHTFEINYTNGWDVHRKREATNHLNALTKFEFIIGIISLYRLLHPIAGLTNKLQGRSIDVIEEYANVSSCVDDMKFIRENIEFQFSKICNQAERMAVKLDVQPCIPRVIPRVAARQMHRDNFFFL